MHTYWAKFEFINQDLFRLDTRVYLSPVDSIQAEDTCVGAIVGKNPGSAQPHITTSCIQPIKLSGDRCLPTVRHIVLKAYTLAGLPLPRRGFIQVLNLFYLCNPNLRRALSAIKAHGDVKCCPAESRTFPWVWYIWGGSSKALNTYKLRFAHIDTSHHFYYDKLNECIVDKAALPNDFAKHTQGLKHKFVVPYIAGLLMECVDTDKVSHGRI